jgi:YidC/Oxa1 family membrane protein insertase
MKFELIEEWKQLKKFENLTDNERSIVFYAENKASINHYRELISEITEKEKLQICYVTSVKNDPILSSKNKNIFSFYIGNGIVRSKFFLTLKAKILLMDMPDLETYHIKRSKSYQVHYIYIFHSMFSIHSYLRKGAIDNYDTIFCVGEHHEKEIRETEKIYGLKPKKMVKYGFGRLDTLLHEKQKFQQTNLDSEKLIIIAPSYGKDNLLEICGLEIIEILLKANFSVLLRPHFKILENPKIKTIQEKFENNPKFIMEKGVIPPEKFYNSICMISDWSGISFEYAFVMKRPVIFIDVPKKEMNPESKHVKFEPIEKSLRNKIGIVISPKHIENIPRIIENSKNIDSGFNLQIKNVCKNTVFNIGNSAHVGTKYIQELVSEM